MLIIAKFPECIAGRTKYPWGRRAVCLSSWV